MPERVEGSSMANRSKITNKLDSGINSSKGIQELETETNLFYHSNS